MAVTIERDDWDKALVARHGSKVHEVLAASVVGVMGLGGLGSAVVMALARIGIGRIIVADYDRVELTNLNRQHYFADQVGLLKADAILANIRRVNPFLVVEAIREKLTEDSIPSFFEGVDVLLECFDDPVMKASALRAVRTSLRSIPYVAASGMAGCGDNNLIRTRLLSSQIYLVGDEESAIGPGVGLMAPRVGIAAHHQANQAVRILLGKA